MTVSSSKKARCLWRRTAVLLLVCVPGFACPVPAASAAPAPAPAAAVSDLSQIRIPAELARVEETFRGKPGPWVILLQDAHAVPDAQRKISRLLLDLQNRYGLDEVAVEGASSELDVQFLR